MSAEPLRLFVTTVGWLRDERGYVTLAVLFFIAGCVAGAASPILQPSDADVDGGDATLSTKLSNPPSALWFAGNNVLVIVMLLTGAAFFGTSSAAILFVNGFIIANDVTWELLLGRSPTLVLVLVIPHGAFELTAILLAGAVGFMIPHQLIRYLVGRDDEFMSKEKRRQITRLIVISILLILIAAVIEAEITPQVASLTGS
jgi:uncharacterized membrane protein SpoIIM required for sporulation